MLAEHDRQSQAATQIILKHDWAKEKVNELFALPFNDLIHQAQTIHRQLFDPNEIQLSTLLNIKEGNCPEDCAYCPQSARYKTSVKADGLLTTEEVIVAAKQAQAHGASRFCMGAAWRSPKEKDLAQVLSMVQEVKSLGLETCATLGMLTEQQAIRLKKAGLDFYNHNLDSSAAYYEKIITTRTYQDRLETLDHVRSAGINVCCGGIVGMGEKRADRIELLMTLANMPKPPESVPINLLVKVAGTPLAEVDGIDMFEFVRTIAVARILMPASYVRLSAGRSNMSDSIQALCFYAGANSIFYGEKLLTTDNPQHQKDKALFRRLGLKGKK